MSQCLKHQVTLILVILGILIVFMSAWPQVGLAQRAVIDDIVVPNSPNIPSTPGPAGGDSLPPPTGTTEVNNNPVKDGDLVAEPAEGNAEAVVPDAGTAIAKFFYWFVHTVFGTMVGWFGSIFDIAVTNYIIDFGNKYNNSGLGGAIDNAWTTIRDIINLAFIFGLVWIGFQMILDNKSNAQRALGMLIAAALLVNFSLFITKFIVDFTNIAAAQIYGAITVGLDEKKSISAAFLNLTGLANVFDNDEAIGPGISQGFSYVFGLMLILVVASFVFAAGAVLIIIRFIVLNIYLVFSPIMFIGWIFPGMASYSRDYWKGFLGRAFFAPAFIFMIYLSYQILGRFQDYGGARSMGDALLKGDESNSEALAFFILAAGFMLASLVVAQKMGANGASAAISVGHNLRKRVQVGLGNSSAGAGAMLGRGTLGRWSNNTAENENLKDRAALKGIKGWSARRKLAVAEAGRSASFDVRQVAGVGKKLGIGEGQKGGYKARVENITKRDQKYGESLGMVGDDDPRVQELIRERERLEGSIQELKDQKTDAPAGQKSQFDKQIRAREKELKDHNERIEKEKRRRQLGSTFTKKDNQDEIAGAEISLKSHKGRLKAKWDEIIEARGVRSDTEIKILEEERSAIQKQIEMAEKALKYAKSMGTEVDGYAEVISAESKLGKLTSLLSGRTWSESNHSASELRKKFTKQTKKTKEEKQNDSIVEEIGKIAKKD